MLKSNVSTSRLSNIMIASEYYNIPGAAPQSHAFRQKLKRNGLDHFASDSQSAPLSWATRRRIIAVLRRACMILGAGQKSRIGKLGGAAIGALIASFAPSAYAQAVLGIGVSITGAPVAASTSTAIGTNAVIVNNTVGQAAPDGQTVIGANASATGSSGVAIGTGATTFNQNPNTGSVAIGNQAQATFNSAIAIGQNARALPFIGVLSGSGSGSIAIGQSALSQGNSSDLFNASAATVIGNNATGNADGAIAIGELAGANAYYATAVGSYANATLAGATAVGGGSQATAVGAIAIGGATSTGSTTGLSGFASSTSANAIAIGRGATVDGNSGATVAIGAGATTNAAVNAVLIGTNAVAGTGTPASGNSQISIGNSANAQRGGAIGVGNLASARGNNSIALGTGSNSGQQNGQSGGNIAIGNLANASNSAANVATDVNQIAIGTSSVASARNAITVGVNSAASGISSLASGDTALASGTSGSAIGHNARASGTTSIAAGSNSTASGDSSVALGNTATANRTYSVAIGDNAQAGIVAGADNTTALGRNALSTGLNGSALGFNSRQSNGGLAVGNDTASSGLVATSVGYRNAALGDFSSAFGASSIANGNRSLAFGIGATAGVAGSQSTITNDVAIGNVARATGGSSTALGDAASATGARSTALGADAATTGASSVAIGDSSSAMQIDAIAFGHRATASGLGAIAIGGNAVASGTDSVSIGRNVTTSGTSAVTIGASNVANGAGAVALGLGQTAIGDGAVAIGDPATVIGTGAVGIGASSNATGNGSVAAGNASQALSGAGTGTIVNRATPGTILTAVSGLANVTPNAVAIGNTNIVNGGGGVAIGENNRVSATAIGGTSIGTENNVTGLFGVGYGYSNTSSSSSTVAIGVANVASGNTGIALGRQSTASGNFSIAQGNVATANQINAIALGNSAQAIGLNAVAIGGGLNGAAGVNLDPTAARATAANTTALGVNTNAGAAGATAIGGNATAGANASGVNSIAVGGQSVASNTAAIAIGNGSTASNTNSIAIGTGNVVSGANSGAFGDPNIVTGTGSYAFGNNNTVNADNAFAIGNSITIATGLNGSVGIGNASTVAAAVGTSSATIGATTFSGFAGSTPASTVSIGASGAERTLTNVAAGRVSASSTDAINGSQLFSVATVVDANKTAIDTLGNSLETVTGGGLVINPNGSIATSPTITTAGATFATTTGAIQALNTANTLTNNGLASALGGGAAVAANGAVTAPAYVVGGTTYNNVGAALGALSTGSLVQQTGGSPGSGQITVGAPTAGTSISVAGTAGSRTVTGILAGSLANASTDAVNGAQINTFGASIATNTGGGSSFNPATGIVTAPTVNVGGTAYSNLTSAIEAAGAGFTLTTAATGSGIANTPTLEGIAAGETVTVSAGNNIITTQTGNNLAVALNPALTGVTSLAITGGPTINGAGITLAAGDTFDAGGNKIINLAAGSTAAGSTEALNGSQLNTALSSVATDLGGGASYNSATGVVTAPGYAIDGTTYTNVGAALAALAADSKYVSFNSALAAASATGTNASAIGPNAQAVGNNAVALGVNSNAAGNNSIAIGGSTDTSATNGTAVGAGSAAQGNSALALGSNAVAGGTNSVALGANAQAGTANAGWTGTIFAGVSQTNNVNANGVVSVSGGSTNRQITGVADGAVNATSTDAISGSQLFATATALDTKATNLGSGLASSLGGGASVLANGTVTNPTYNVGGTNVNNVGAAINALQSGSPLQYSTAGAPTTANGLNKSQNVTLVGAAAGPVTLDNIAAGTTTAGSTQGINGGQLNTGLASVAANLGGGSSYNPATGVVTTPTYIIAGTTYNDVGSALGSLATGGAVSKYFHARSTLADSTAVGADSVAIGPNAAAINDGDVALGSGALTAAPHSGAFSITGGTVAAIAPASVLSIGASGLERQIQNVAAGVVSAISTDAVNGSQLFSVASASLALGNSLETVTGGGLALNPDGTVATPATVTVGGIAYNDLSSAIQANDAKATKIGAGVASSLGGGAAVAADGTLTAPTYTLGGTSFADVGSALSSLANGTTGIVQQTGGAPGNGQITVGAATGGTSVSVAGTGGNRTVTGVTAGALSVTSVDAVNGSQVNTLATSVATNLGGGSAFNPLTGSVTAPSYTVQGTTSTNVGAAIANVDGVLTGLTNGTTGLVQQTGGSPGSGQITVGAATGGTSLSVAGTAGNRTITGVTAGDLGATSVEAVNGAQVNNALTSVASSLGGGATFNPATGLITAPAFTVQGTTYNNVGSAIGGLDSSVTALKSGAVGLIQFSNAGATRTSANGGTPSQNVTLVGANPAAAVTVSNVAGGEISASSTDAVNGAQIFALGTALGGGSTFGPNGTVTPPAYTVNGSTFNNAGDAFAAVNNSLTGAGIKYFHTNSTQADSAPLGTDSVAIGPVSGAGGNRSISIGLGANAGGSQSIAIGTGNVVSGNNSGAIGDPSTITGNESYVLGNNNNVASNNAFVIGNNVTIAAGNDGSVAIGNAATVAAPNAGAKSINGGTIAATAPTAVVSVGGAGTERQITNVAAGVVSAASADAVNGSQLFAVGSAINKQGTGLAAALGGGAAVAPDGTVTAPAYTVQGATLNNVGAAIGAVDTRLTQLANGTTGIVQQTGGAPGAGVISVGGTTGGTRVSVAGTSGNRVVTGVANGALTATSTDAVNGGQLVAAQAAAAAATTSLGQTTATALGGGSTFNPATGQVSAPSYSVGGRAYGNVGAALTATNALAVQYVPDANGAPTNAVRLSGNGTGAAVAVTNVAAGAVTVASTDAVNGGQLFAVQQIATGAVQYDRNPDGTPNRSSVSLGTPGTPVTLTNVAAGVRASDAVNLGQLQGAATATLAAANSYTDGRITALTFDLKNVAKRAYAGTAAAIALQAPALFEPGAVAMRFGAGVYRGEYAIGASLRATGDNGKWSLTGGISGGPNSGVAASAGIDILIGN